MQLPLFLALAATALGVAIPEPGDHRSPTYSDISVTRTFDLPPVPFPTGVGISFPPEAKKRSLDEEALRIANEEALFRRDGSQSFGAAPNASQVQMTGVTYGGTGCPSSSVGSAVSADRTTMTLIFDDYVASIGGGAPITESRKNCQLNLNLQYPGGFQYSVFSADYRGYAYLDQGVSGSQKSIYYFSGQTAQVSFPFVCSTKPRALSGLQSDNNNGTIE